MYSQNGKASEAPKMEMKDLKKHIDNALTLCEEKLTEPNGIVFSEADFERLVSWSIMKELGQTDYDNLDSAEFVVHTQVSHYSDKTNKVNKRIDIVLFRNAGIESVTGNGKVKYTGDSFALELKYIPKGRSISRVKDDFKKRESLDSTSWLYVVVCIEEDNIERYEKKKEKIQAMEDSIINQHSGYEENLFHYCILKKIPEATNKTNQA